LLSQGGCFFRGKAKSVTVSDETALETGTAEYPEQGFSQQPPPPSVFSVNSDNIDRSLTKVDDLVLLVTGGGKRHLLRLQPGRQFHSNLGKVMHDELIDLPYGYTVYSHLGHAFLLLEPSLDDRMTRIKRNTQIIYPKDAAMIVRRLSLQAGSRVIEAGTGSGGLSVALAWAVAPSGRVFSYEIRDEHVQVARSNLEKMGLLQYVELHNASILDGFNQSKVDALVLDLRTPWIFLEQAHKALRPGGFFAALVPTTNQVSDLLHGLEDTGFADICVEEVLVRNYKPVPDRLRPDDSMVGHTVFVISARPIVDPEEPGRWLSEGRKRYEARKKLSERIEEEESKRASQSPDQGSMRPKLP
jgi:tRNA (adenine57-N1/adenine58-N1)-methyltransferase